MGALDGFLSDINSEVLLERGEVLEDGSLHISKTKLGEGTYVISGEVRNTTQKNIKINSVILADFSLPVLPEKVLKNGLLSTSECQYVDKITPTRRSPMDIWFPQNPFSFRQDFGYLKRSLISEWFTELKFEEKSLVIGALTTQNQFSQIFVQKESKDSVHVRVTCQLDGKELQPGESVSLEDILFSLRDEDENLDYFASKLAEWNELNMEGEPISALCCAYYARGMDVSEEYILKELEHMEKHSLQGSIQYVQIDEGYCTRGDWMKTHSDRFPNGLNSLTDSISESGFKAGIWIAPLLAAKKSEVYTQHPDWFLPDKSMPPSRLTTIMPNKPFDDMAVLNITNPDAKEYIKECIAGFVESGFSLIKVDFLNMYGHLESPPGNLTRAEMVSETLSVIREAAGPDVHLLSAITPLSSAVGLVDSARISIDTSFPFIYNIPIINSLVNNELCQRVYSNMRSRNFLNGAVWHNDGDCLVTAKKAGIAKKHVDEHFKELSSYGGSFFIGDCLHELPEEKLKEYYLKDD